MGRRLNQRRDEDTVLLLALLLLESVAQAQIEKGQGVRTGSINGSFNRFTSQGNSFINNQKQGSLLASYGHFIKRGLLIGAELSLDGSSQRGKDKDKATGEKYSFNSSSSLTFAPFSRYYWQRDRLLGYIGGGLLLGKSTYGNQFAILSSTTAYSIDLQGQAGIIYRNGWG